MALKTNYKDDKLSVLVTGSRRRYIQHQNVDETVSFEDVSVYEQVGDNFGANDINATNEQVNKNESDIQANADDIAVINDDLDTLKGTGEGSIAKMIADAIAQKTHMRTEVVDEPPTVESAESQVIYLVKVEGETNVYEQYALITNAEGDKQIGVLGRTKVDLSNFYTKEEADSLLGDKADATDLDNFYTKEDVYTKDEVADYFTNHSTTLCDYTVTVDKTKWVKEEGETKYSQTIEVEHLSATDSPIVTLEASGITASDSELAAYSCISDITLDNGSITFYANTRPTDTINVKLKGVGKSVDVSVYTKYVEDVANQFGDADISDIGDGTIKGAINQLAESSYKLIWTNPNYSVTFDAQTISLDLSKYEFIKISYGNYKGESEMIKEFHLEKRQHVLDMALAASVSGYKCNVYRRDFDTSEQSIHFGDEAEYHDGTVVTGNNNLIPFHIWAK